MLVLVYSSLFVSFTYVYLLHLVYSTSTCAIFLDFYPLLLQHNNLLQSTYINQIKKFKE
jgi:hypothetical protein